MIEDEINQGMKENPQDLSKGTSDDSSSFLGEAQEDIQPLNHLSQEKESHCSYFQRQRKMPPFLMEEEINQLLNMQTASKTSYDQIFSNHSPANLAYHKSKNKLLDQLK